MTTIFSETLTRFRKEAGFPTAYKFFHGNGGDKVLGMCYRKYLLYEKGGILPLFSHLRGFVFGLHIEPDSGRARELIGAWLRTMAGEEAFDEMLKPMFSGMAAGTGLSPMHKTMERSLAGNTYHVTPEQVAAIAASQANFRCFIAMSNVEGTWTPEQLAPRLQMGAAETKKALSALAEVKLMTRVKNAFKCPCVANFVVFPKANSGLAGEYAKIKKYQDELLASGKRVWFRSLFVRVDNNSIPGMLELMGVTVASVNGYSVTAKSDTSAVFSIDASVTKLLDF